MILFTNGSNHTAGAECVNNFAFAEDDRKYWAQGRRPHPDNLAASWGPPLATIIKMSFHCGAESERSNAQIISTTKEWIKYTADTVDAKDTLLIIQWSTWDGTIAATYEDIIEFHKYLNELGYKHIFFNGNDSFIDIPKDQHYDFGASYINPYLPEGTFHGWLQLNGFNTVITSNHLYGRSAHASWTKHLLKHILENKII